MKTSRPADVETYIASFPTKVQAILRQVRKTIKQAAPAAAEAISYGMPGYKLHGKPLMYFAGYAKHLGLYATPTGHAAFQKQLAAYKQGKGSVQFPIDQPIPYGLIAQIAAFRAQALTPKSTKLSPTRAPSGKRTSSTKRASLAKPAPSPSRAKRSSTGNRRATRVR